MSIVQPNDFLTAIVVAKSETKQSVRALLPAVNVTVSGTTPSTYCVVGGRLSPHCLPTLLPEQVVQADCVGQVPDDNRIQQSE